MVSPTTFQLQPAPVTRNRGHRACHSYSQSSSGGDESDASICTSYSDHPEGQSKPNSSNRKSVKTRFHEHFSWATLPPTAVTPAIGRHGLPRLLFAQAYPAANAEEDERVPPTPKVPSLYIDASQRPEISGITSISSGRLAQDEGRESCSEDGEGSTLNHSPPSAYIDLSSTSKPGSTIESAFGPSGEQTSDDEVVEMTTEQLASFAGSTFSSDDSDDDVDSVASTPVPLLLSPCPPHAPQSVSPAGPDFESWDVPASPRSTFSPSSPTRSISSGQPLLSDPALRRETDTQAPDGNVGSSHRRSASCPASPTHASANSRQAEDAQTDMGGPSALDSIRHTVLSMPPLSPLSPRTAAGLHTPRDAISAATTMSAVMSQPVAQQSSDMNSRTHGEDSQFHVPFWALRHPEQEQNFKQQEAKRQESATHQHRARASRTSTSQNDALPQISTFGGFNFGDFDRDRSADDEGLVSQSPFGQPEVESPARVRPWLRPSELITTKPTTVSSSGQRGARIESTVRAGPGPARRVAARVSRRLTGLVSWRVGGEREDGTSANRSRRRSGKAHMPMPYRLSPPLPIPGLRNGGSMTASKASNEGKTDSRGPDEPAKSQPKASRKAKNGTGQPYGFGGLRAPSSWFRSNGIAAPVPLAPLPALHTRDRKLKSLYLASEPEVSSQDGRRDAHNSRQKNGLASRAVETHGLDDVPKTKEDNASSVRPSAVQRTLTAALAGTQALGQSIVSARLSQRAAPWCRAVHFKDVDSDTSLSAMSATTATNTKEGDAQTQGHRQAVVVRYNGDSAEGRPASETQDVKRKGGRLCWLVAGVLLGSFLLINVIVLDIKFLSTSSNSSMHSSPTTITTSPDPALTSNSAAALIASTIATSTADPASSSSLVPSYSSSASSTSTSTSSSISGLAVSTTAQPTSTSSTAPTSSSQTSEYSPWRSSTSGDSSTLTSSSATPSSEMGDTSAVSATASASASVSSGVDTTSAGPVASAVQLSQ